MDEKMREDLEKAKEEISKKSEHYELRKQKETEELMQRRANLIGSFIHNQKESDYRRITKVTYRFSGNVVEDYILVSIYEEDKLLAVSSNILGIEHLDSFPQHLAERFFEFSFSNYMDLLDVSHGTLFEINFEK
jgi:hypothetical protein